MEYLNSIARRYLLTKAATEPLTQRMALVDMVADGRSKLRWLKFSAMLTVDGVPVARVHSTGIFGEQILHWLDPKVGQRLEAELADLCKQVPNHWEHTVDTVCVGIAEHMVEAQRVARGKGKARKGGAA